MKTCLLASLLCLLSCGSEPPPPPDGGCAANTAAYPDADGDGWGSALASPTMVCAGQVPAGYTTANHLDCGDGDARANPNQAVFQTTPIVGQAPNVWDFDCDGVATLQYPSAPRPCNTIGGGGGCLGTPGTANTWFGTAPAAPACGVSGAWMISCQSFLGGCQPNNTQRTQGCL